MLAHLAEDDESLLEAPPPLAEGLMIDRLYQTSWQARYLPFIVLFGLFALFRDHVGWIEVTGLTLLYALGTGWLDQQRRAFAEAEDRLFHPAYWGRRFAVGSAITGLAWGILGWGLLPVEDAALRVVPLLVWAGLLITSFTGRYLHLPSYYAFMLPASLPLLARGLLLQDQVLYFLLLFAAALAAGVSLRAHAANRRDWLALATRLRNAELLVQMDQARAAAQLAQQVAEQALAELVDELQLVESLGRFGFWSWAADSGRAEWSAHLLAILGLGAAQSNATLDVLLQRLHPDDRAGAAQFFRQIRSSGAAEPLTLRVALPEGGYGEFRLIGAAKEKMPGLPLHDVRGILLQITP